MQQSLAFPPDTDIDRYGNLMVSAWSPRSHPSLSSQWLEDVLRVLLSDQADVHLLGHRPGKLKGLPQDLLTDEVRRLLNSLRTAPGPSPLVSIPKAAANECFSVLRAGDLNVRLRTLDVTTGMGSVESTHLGRFLILSNPNAVVSAICGPVVAPPLQVSFACLANPGVGLRQPEKNWLLSAKNWTGNQVAASWQGTSLCLYAGLDTLSHLKVLLLARLQNASEA